MSRVAEIYVRWLADYYLLATILLGLSLIGIALLKQPVRRLAVAKSTLVSLILLALLCAIPGWSVVHLLTEERPQPVAEFHDEVSVQPVVMAERTRPMVTDALPPVQEDVTAPVVNNDPLPEPSIDFHVSWPALFATTHLAGAAGIVLWLTFGWIASTRLRRTAQPAPTDLVAVLNQVFGQAHVTTQRPQLLTHERVDVAVALGAWRPTILLPTRWIRSESQDHLRTVLAHEATHILNQDLQWVALTRMLFIALWANPLFWISRRWLRRDQEALADAAAAELTSRQRYAEQLVAWARDAHSRPALHLSSAVGLWEGPSQLRQRIAILLNERFVVLRNCSRRWRLAAALTLIAGATALSLVTIQPGQSQAAAKETEPTAPDAPVKPATGALTIRFEYDGTPPAPKELKEYGWRAKLDDRDLGHFNIEKTVGAKVFDESLVVGKDRGIANVFVYMPGKNIPNVATVDSVTHHFDKQRGMTVPDKYKGPPATLSYRNGRYEPHALAFEWPRQLVLRNDDPKPVTYINYMGKASTDPMLKPGAELALEVRPELPIPIKMAGNPLQWLEAYVLPLGHPFFAVSDEHGKIRIENLPPGNWEFQVWHERCGYVKTEHWTKGRFTLDIKPGDNDLGIVKLGPKLLNEPQPSPPESTTSTNAPGEKQPASAVISPAEPTEQPKQAPVPFAANPQADEEKPAAKSTPNPLPQDSLFKLYRKHFKLPEPNVVGGFVVDEKLQPIANAKVSVFRTNWRDYTRKLIAEKSTDADGKVRFDQVFDIAKEFPGGKIPPDYGIGEELLQVVVRAPGRVTDSRFQARQLVAKRGEPLMIIMPPATTLRGRVTGPDGKPVAGALVAVGKGAPTAWAGAEPMTARSDADGNYVIDDVPHFDLKAQAEQEAAMRSRKDAAMNAFRASPQVLILTVEHPNFAVGKAQIEKTPGTTDIQLQPAAILAGRIVFGDSGKPAGGARVWIAGHHQKLSETKRDDAGNNDEQRRYAMPFYTASTRADSDGKYRFATLPPGYYHLLAEMPGWVHVGLRDVSAEAGKTTEVPDLTLTKGGTVSIRLIDAKTREPIQVPPEALALIGSSERPIFDRPPIEQRVSANKNGLFELSLPAGKHEIYIGGVYVGEDRKWVSDYTTPTESPNEFVTVTDSKTVQVDMPVIDAKSAKVTGAFVTGPLPKAESQARPRTEKTQNETSNDKSKQMSTPRQQPNVVSGQTLDERRQPIAGVEVFLFRIQQQDGSRKLVTKGVTDADGQYQFGNVIDIDKEFPGRKFPSSNEPGDEMLQGVVRAPGRVSHWWWMLKQLVAQRGDYQQVQMFPSASLRGTVTDADGKPVAGALVSIGTGSLERWEGAMASRTGAKGNYKIDDVGPYNAAELDKQITEQKRQQKEQDAKGNRTWVSFLRHPVLTVEHPDYAMKHTNFEKSPGTKDIQLDPAASLEGRVVFADTGKPAAGVLVGAGTSVADRGPPTAELLREIVKTAVRTDADGKYRVTGLPAGKYDLWAETPDWVNVGLNDVVATPRKAASVPDLTFTKGGVVSARLVDAKTREPIAVQPDARAYFLIRPVSERLSVRPQSAPFITPNAKGRFELNLIPGKKMMGAGGVEIGGKFKFTGQPPAEVTVVQGETVDVDVPVSELQQEKENVSGHAQALPRAPAVVGQAASLRANGKPLEAIKLLKTVLDKDPNNIDALMVRADAWQTLGEDRKAIAEYEHILILKPSPVRKMIAWNNLAFILAASPDDGVRDGKRAVEMAETAQLLQETPTYDVLDTLAAACAEIGQFDRAVKAEQEAITLAPEAQREELRKYLKLYEAHKPRRETRATNDQPAHKNGGASTSGPKAAEKSAQATPAATELTGRVEDPDGEPLAGVTVDAFTWYRGNEARTDAEGRFRLKGFDANSKVEIEFRKKGFGPRHFNVQRTGTPNWVVQMDNTTYLEGVLVDPKGEPVPNALIRAGRDALNEYGNTIGEVFTDVRTDKNGHYRLYLEPDTYGTKIRVPGRGVARYEKQKIARGEQKLFNINLQEGVTFRAVVKDSVTGKPVQGIVLFHYQHKGTEATSNAEGILEVPAMFPGSFEFNVTAVSEDRMRTSVAGNYARWWSPEALKPYQREYKGERDGFQRNFDGLEFEIAGGADPATIYVEPCVTIIGRVVDPDGKPVAGATATLARTGTGNSLAGDTRFSYTTKPDGTFEIKAPASGAVKYNLIAHDGGYQKWRNWANAANEPFSTKPGDKIDNVELRLTRPATIRGRVLTDLRNPVPDKEVRAADVQAHDNRYYVPTTKTDAKGNFELKFVSPGKHYVQLAQTLDPSQAAANTSTVVDVKEGEPIDGVQIGPQD